MKKMIIVLVMALLLAVQAWAGEMSNAEYMYKLQGIIEDKAIPHTKYHWEAYLKYCGYIMTPGGFWRCQEALDRGGIPNLGCENPTYLWVHEDGIKTMLSRGWKQAPLKSSEEIINRPFAPEIYWFYKCQDCR